MADVRHHIIVELKKGEPWRDELEEVCRWGGWSEKEDAEASKTSGHYMPSDSGMWPYTDYCENGKLTTTFWFLAPPEVHYRVFGPKFNEYGEIAP